MIRIACPLCLLQPFRCFLPFFPVEDDILLVVRQILLDRVQTRLPLLLLCIGIAMDRIRKELLFHALLLRDKLRDASLTAADLLLESFAALLIELRLFQELRSSSFQGALLMMDSSHCLLLSMFPLLEPTMQDGTVLLQQSFEFLCFLALICIQLRECRLPLSHEALHRRKIPTFPGVGEIGRLRPVRPIVRLCIRSRPLSLSMREAGLLARSCGTGDPAGRQHFLILLALLFHLLLARQNLLLRAAAFFLLLAYILAV